MNVNHKSAIHASREARPNYIAPSYLFRCITRRIEFLLTGFRDGWCSGWYLLLLDLLDTVTMGLLVLVLPGLGNQGDLLGSTTISPGSLCTTLLPVISTRDICIKATR